MITLERLIAAGIAPTQARLFEGPLSAACERFEINTPERVGAFIGQCRVESRNFTVLEENLNYRDPARLFQVFPSRVRDLRDAAALITGGPKAIASRVYSGRYGNGDEASGDGWRYRGRGLKQLTFRSNYQDAEVALGAPYVDEPDLVGQPEHAVLTAAWFWNSIKGNYLADAWNVDAITRAVNGPAMLQADTRRRFSADAREAFES